MPQQPYWFRSKRRGWGWGLPTPWQGWVVLAGYLALAFGGIPAVHAARGNLAYLVYLSALTALLVGICWLKGEPPKSRGQDHDA